MKVSARVVRSLFASLPLLLASLQAHAINNWENGKDLHDAKGCATTPGCHGLKSGRSASDITDAIADQAPMNARFSAGKADFLSASDISDIAAYLNNLNFPKITVSGSLDLGTRVAKLTTNSVLLTVSNDGFGDDLNLTGAAVADTLNFGVSPTTCTITVGNSCDLTVTFKPQVAGNPLSTTLTLTHNALFGSTTVNLSGIGVLPLELSGSPTVGFNSGDPPKPVRVVENVSHNVRLCKSGAATFPAPDQFAVSGVALDPVTGCGTFGVAGTVPRNLDISVTFLAPAGSGPKNAVLTFQRLSGAIEVGDPVTVQLQGNLGPVIHFDDTDPFNHGPTDQTEVDGSAFTERVIKISNAGNGPLHFTSFVITSADPAQPAIASEYTLAGTGCQVLAVLQPTDPACSLTLRFDPAALGLRAAKLTITSDGKNLPQPQVIPLNGTGKHGPRLAVADGPLVLASNATIDFTSQRLGQAYPARTVTLRNGGTLGDLEVVLPAPTTVPGFTATPGPGCSTLQPGVSCSLAITFTPTALQHYGGAFDIQSRPAGSVGAFNVFRLNFAGDGTDQAPVLTWRDPPALTTIVSSMAYGEVQAGNSLDRHVAIYNAGPGSVSLQVINVVGLDAANFSLDLGTCKLNTFIGESSSCEVILRFAPVTAGAKSASLQVISDGNGPFALPVSGTGRAGATAPVLAFSASALAFDDTRVGARSAPLEVTLMNSGTLPLTVQAVAATGPYEVQGKTCQTTPFVLMPASQCTMSVSFKPLATGGGEGALSVTTDASATPMSVALSGDGVAAADVSSGGCAIVAGDARGDPTLWLLVLLAAGVLWQRRRRHVRNSAAAPSAASRERSSR